jgi:ABC-2 type transport system permease protein
MLKVLKNEFIKMLNGRTFYILAVLVIFSIVIEMIMMKSSTQSQMNAQNFFEQALFGMAMKPIVPMFMALVVAETFTEDYSHGTMKFSLMTGVKRSELILGKLVFIALYAVIFLVVTFVSSYIIGTITLGTGIKGEFFNNLIFNVKLCSSVILPLISFSIVLSFVALLINNSGAMVGFGIGVAVIMFVLDQIKNVMYFTFSGGMYGTDVARKFTTHNVLIFTLTACIYILIFTLLDLIVIRKKDILL